MSQRWINVWDDKKTITGSVYLTPTYASGPEAGQPVYTAPATAHMTPGQGAPARHMNYALFQLGDDRIKADQHTAMVFRMGVDWPSTKVFAVEQGRKNRAFLVSALNGIYLTENDASLAGSLQLYSTTAARSVLWDAGDHVWDIDDGVNDTHRIESTSVTNTNDATTRGVIGGVLGSNSLYLYTSGTALGAQSITGTSWTSTGVPSGTYASSTTSVWGRSQVFLGANTATGPLLFFSRDVSTNNYLYSTDGLTLNKGTWPVSTSATKICDVGYDDVQSAFVLCTRPTAGGQCSFYTSPDGVTWTVSATATGPVSSTYVAPTDGSTAFKVLCGVWLMATTVQYSGAVFGTATISGVAVFCYYSLDYGVTWYPGNILPGVGSAGLVRIAHSVNRFCVNTDKWLAISGRVGYPELA